MQGVSIQDLFWSILSPSPAQNMIYVRARAGPSSKIPMPSEPKPISAPISSQAQLVNLTSFLAWAELSLKIPNHFEPEPEPGSDVEFVPKPSRASQTWTFWLKLAEAWASSEHTGQMVSGMSDAVRMLSRWCMMASGKSQVLSRSCQMLSGDVKWCQEGVRNKSYGVNKLPWRWHTVLSKNLLPWQ